jgi:hypothetical protein
MSKLVLKAIAINKAFWASDASVITWLPWRFSDLRYDEKRYHRLHRRHATGQKNTWFVVRTASPLYGGLFRL